MWVILAFISALCLGFYDVSKKIALRSNGVVNVLTTSVCISSILLFIPLVLSRTMPDVMAGTPFYVPTLDLTGHLFTLLKSCIVLSSWIFAYVALKHLPISVVSPWQATRPVWTLIGAMILFDERLNTWQWAGVTLAIGSILLFSFTGHSQRSKETSPTDHTYAICLALAIIIGACSGLYDKYMMRRYDHNAVQVYYTFYQALMMSVVWFIHRRKSLQKGTYTPLNTSSLLPIALISIFLVISDNVYMLALRNPESMIAVVSTIRRGGAIIGLAYGLLFLKEKDPWKKVLCMIGILAGLICLAMG